jgi:hypothetical protein
MGRGVERLQRLHRVNVQRDAAFGRIWRDLPLQVSPLSRARTTAHAAFDEGAQLA